MEENKTVEVTTEDKIAKLKTTLEGMELLGATIPQTVKDTVSQEITVLEEKLKAEIEAVETETVSLWVKYRTEIIIIVAMFIIHVAGKVGL